MVKVHLYKGPIITDSGVQQAQCLTRVMAPISIYDFSRVRPKSLLWDLGFRSSASSLPTACKYPDNYNHWINLYLAGYLVPASGTKPNYHALPCPFYKLHMYL